MNVTRLSLAILALVLSLLTTANMADAQPARTWVSGVGDDANPCSRTAPCKTFAGAISKTAAAGEIDVLDPGSFGAVTITKSISIVAEGVVAGILGAGTNGIIVNAGAGDVVVIRGLDIEGTGTGVNGINFLAGGALHVEKSTINHFTGVGINFVPTGGGTLFVKDTVIRGNLGGGILVRGGTGNVAASIDNVRLEANTFGLRAEDHTKVVVNRSTAVANGTNGFIATSGAAGAELTLYNSVSASNGNSLSTGGVRASGAQGLVRMQNVTVVGNTVGLVETGGGQIASWGSNYIAGNTFGDGSPTVSLPLQ